MTSAHSFLVPNPEYSGKISLSQYVNMGVDCLETLNRRSSFLPLVGLPIGQEWTDNRSTTSTRNTLHYRVDQHLILINNRIISDDLTKYNLPPRRTAVTLSSQNLKLILKDRSRYLWGIRKKVKTC